MSTLVGDFSLNYYRFGQDADQIADSTYPPGQEIITQFPDLVAKIRVVAYLAFTAFVVFTVTGTTLWAWPVVILGVGLSARVVQIQLCKEDPLVDVFYRIAGSKEAYEQLPEVTIASDKKTHENFHRDWNSLEHPVFRFTTTDGRKGMLIKAARHRNNPLDQVVTLEKVEMVFIEKLQYGDIPNHTFAEDILDILSPSIVPIFIALTADFQENKTISRLTTRHDDFNDLHLGVIQEGAPAPTSVVIQSYILGEIANEFIAQRQRA